MRSASAPSFVPFDGDFFSCGDGVHKSKSVILPDFFGLYDPASAGLLLVRSWGHVYCTAQTYVCFRDSGSPGAVASAPSPRTRPD